MFTVARRACGLKSLCVLSEPTVARLVVLCLCGSPSSCFHLLQACLWSVSTVARLVVPQVDLAVSSGLKSLCLV